MDEGEFQKKYRTLEDITDYYMDANSTMTYMNAELLAIKRVLTFKDNNIKSDYLSSDLFLDSMNYSKEFKNERMDYLKYIHKAMNGLRKPGDRIKYMKNLSKKSRTFKRFIAARIQDDLHEDDIEAKVESEVHVSIYDIAKNYLHGNISNNAKVCAIRKAIEETVLDFSQKSQIQIMGENPFLDYIFAKSKLEEGRVELFEREFESFFGAISDPSQIHKRRFYQNILRDSKKNLKEKILSDRIQKMHFPISGLDSKKDEYVDNDYDPDDDEGDEWKKDL